MADVRTAPFVLEHSFADELEGMSTPWEAAVAPAPRLLAFNAPLATDLGLDPEALRTEDGVAALVGNAVAPGSRPVAQGYAGHQFGGYQPRLGDGRALLLGELRDPQGRRHDLHLKGSGRTPYSRGGDGKAAVGPMLREYVLGEAMHALGVPTTRALAVVGTGEAIMREGPLPGAVLTRVAASHLRVGSFQYAARLQDGEALPRLVDYAIARHYPELAGTREPELAFYTAVVQAQAELVARWMLVGFVHGVLNTDNVSIAGETIDYGPCAFIDTFDPAAVFSSIDQAGRYAYGNQPSITQWNLARFAETLLPRLGATTEAAVAAATAVLETFPDRYRAAWVAGMDAKLGLAPGTGLEDDDRHLGDELLNLAHSQRVDFTGLFRDLAEDPDAELGAARARFSTPEAFDAWAARWRARRLQHGQDAARAGAAMRTANPVVVPRNHQVEAALQAATAGDLEPFERLVEAVSDPFVRHPDRAAFAAPAPATFGPYTTFCGT